MTLGPVGYETIRWNARRLKIETDPIVSCCWDEIYRNMREESTIYT